MSSGYFKSNTFVVISGIISNESNESGDGSVLIVSGTATGSPGTSYYWPEGEADGTYRIVDATATGTARKWKH